jgi:hypothetical protein
MNWTREKPTKPGWYWHRLMPHTERRVLHVFKLAGALVVDHTKWSAPAKVEEYRGLWCGPIEEPDHDP